jgi:hypothetical protein
MSVTVNAMRAAAGAEPLMSAWLPITRASVMCVKSVSLSARCGELLVEFRKLRLELRFWRVLDAGSSHLTGGCL